MGSQVLARELYAVIDADVKRTHRKGKHVQTQHENRRRIGV